MARTLLEGLLNGITWASGDIYRAMGRSKAKLLRFQTVTALIAAIAVTAFAAGEDMTELYQSVKKSRAPELDGASAWINVDHPLKLADLKGKVVLLDFWTFG